MNSYCTWDSISKWYKLDRKVDKIRWWISFVTSQFNNYYYKVTRIWDSISKWFNLDLKADKIRGQI